mgnify:CR=1 FL=1
MTTTLRESQPFLIPPESDSHKLDIQKTVHVGIENLDLRDWLLKTIDVTSNYSIIQGRIGALANVSLRIVDLEYFENTLDFNEDIAKVLVVGAGWSDSDIVKAFMVGASGFVTSSCTPNFLVRVIESTLNSKGPYVLSQISQSSNASDLIRRRFFTEVVDSDSFDQINCPLTEREISILTYIGRGDSSRSIGQVFGLGEQTIKNYVSTILLKTNTKNRANALSIAFKNGWINSTNLID